MAGRAGAALGQTADAETSQGNCRAFDLILPSTLHLGSAAAGPFSGKVL